jgi:hypothetical protein
MPPQVTIRPSETDQLSQRFITVKFPTVTEVFNGAVAVKTFLLKRV